MEFKNYYQTLGIERDASADEVKRAYRRLARKYHPDVSKEADAETRIVAINEAYEVLKDPEKRAAYDQLGQQWRQGQDFRPPPDWDAGFEFAGGGYTAGDAGEFSDFFETLFGHAQGAAPRGRRHYRGRGEDHHAKIVVDLEDVFRGGTHAMTLRSPGLDPSGHLRVHERTLNVTLPRGVREGQVIRLKGQGGPAVEGGEAGDLYLEVHLRPHALYAVEGRDLYLSLPVAPWEAALGATVRAPTPEGAVEVKVPAGSQGGRKLRLRGRGLPGDPPGDLYVTLQIALPPADNDDARQAYRALQNSTAFNPRKALGV